MLNQKKIEEQSSNSVYQVRKSLLFFLKYKVAPIPTIVHIHLPEARLANLGRNVETLIVDDNPTNR